MPSPVTLFMLSTAVSKLHPISFPDVSYTSVSSDVSELLESECFLLSSLVLPSRSNAFVRSQKPNVTLPLEGRLQVLSQAIQKAVDLMARNDKLFTTVTLCVDMAEADKVKQQIQYKDWLKSFMQDDRRKSSVFSHSETYGHAAAQAYLAYNDAVFLDLAVEAWNRGRMYTLTDDGLADTAVKEPIVQQYCNGGAETSVQVQDIGTQNSSSQEMQLDARQTGRFLSLSASLAEITSNQTYATAVNRTRDFIFTHLYDEETNAVFQSISADGCIPVKSDNLGCAGLVVEGLSFVTESFAQYMLQSVVINAVSNPSWHSEQGVLQNGANRLPDSYFLRGLHALYVTNKVPMDLRRYLASYIGVQYNAVLDLSHNMETDFYGPDWRGPPPKEFSMDNQVAALGPLMAAVVIGTMNYTTSSNDTAATTPISDPTAPVSPGDNGASSKSIAPIIGGAVGGGLIVLLFTGAFLYWYRRKRQTAPTPEVVSATPWISQPLETDLHPLFDSKMLVLSPRTLPSTTTGTGTSVTSSIGDHTHALEALQDDVEHLRRLLNERQHWDDMHSVAPPSYYSARG
ncbi:hypothetical protein VNI00_015651 [Paramarasmius palmivorus]|uniref:Glycoside hydrolase family 76 protein n=1 Tax=Paramarasmius palmivorus TaxID=297713 RepID=A0AAW0BJ83_9AGAR